MSKSENICKMNLAPCPDFDRLHCRAEQKIETLEALEGHKLFSQQAQCVLHELQAHQIELEMQNEELQNAQAALDISVTRYFDLYDQAPVGYCTISSSGLILETNLTLTAMLGTARGDLLGLQLARFLHREDQDIYYLHLGRLFKTGQRKVCEARMLRKNVGPFWARLESILSRDEDDRPICRMTISDITEARVAEAEACAQKEILDKVFENAPYMMILLDSALRVTKINRACADFWGGSKEEVLGLLAGEAFNCLNCFNKIGCGKNEQCSGCPVRSRVMRTLRTGESIHDAEGTMTIRKGSAQVEVDILISTTLIRDKGADLVLLTIADVTERTRAQRALRDSEERFRELAENIRDVFWARTSDKLLYVSPAYEQVWGRRRESLYEDPASFSESVHPDHRDQVMQAFPIGDEEGGPVCEEFKILRPDGTLRWIRARSFPISGQGAIRQVGIAEDITAGREAEELLRIEKKLALGLGSSGSLVEAMENLLNSCLQFDELDSGGIYLVEEETGALDLVCHQGLSEAFTRNAAVYEPRSSHVCFALQGRVGYWQKPFERLEIAGLAEQEGISAFLVLPIKNGEEITAVLYLASHSQPQISRNVQSALQVIAAHIGSIVSRIRMADTVKSQSERLLEANAALKVLLKQREEDRTELQESLLKNAKHLIMPYVAKLNKSRLSEEQKNLVQTLESHLLEITSPFVHKISEPLLGLTPTEIRVADLIRQGKSTKEISDLLGISEYAVIFHRQGIRRKLGLTGKKVNLQTYLRTLQQQ